MITGTTSSGFEFEISPEAINDMELLEALCDLDRGDASALAEICRRLLGDQKKALYEHLRIDGRVPANKVIEAVGEILAACKEGKKS